MAMMAKARRMIAGWAMSKAGCTWEMAAQTIAMIRAKPDSCQRMSAAAKTRRSPKKAAGSTRARKNTSPLMTSFSVAITSG